MNGGEIYELPGFNMLHFENTDSDFLNTRMIESTTQRNKKN